MVKMIIVAACFLIVFITIGILSGEIADARKDLSDLQDKINLLRTHLDAHDEILLKEISKSEDLEYKLIAIQNAYVKVKRDNEKIAHQLARGETNESNY